MTRLDHNRAHGPTGRTARAIPVTDISRMTIWGNHSATQYPDLSHTGRDRWRAGRRR